MTPTRLVRCLESLNWSTDQLAATFECDEALIEAWVLGFEEIPVKAAAWIETLAQIHECMESEKPKSLRGVQFQGFPKPH